MNKDQLQYLPPATFRYRREKSKCSANTGLRQTVRQTKRYRPGSSCTHEYITAFISPWLIFRNVVVCLVLCEVYGVLPCWRISLVEDRRPLRLLFIVILGRLVAIAQEVVVAHSSRLMSPHRGTVLVRYGTVLRNTAVRHCKCCAAK